MTLADARLLHGDLFLRGNDPKPALEDARAVIATNPARIDAYLLEIRALAASGDEKAARKEVDTVLHRVPKDVAANYLRVILAIRANDYAAADASLLQIGPAIASLPRGFYFLAVTKLALQHLSEAEEAATQFLAQNPDDSAGLKLMAFVDLARNHPDRTLALLQNGPLATHADADTYDLRGRALALSGDLKGARENLAKAAGLHPADPSILNRLAAVEMDLGNIPAGEADLKHSLQLAPKQDRTGAAIVEADLARFDLAAAHQDLDALRSSFGDVEAVELLDAQIKLATLDTGGAESELLAIRKRFPNSRAAVLFLVRLYRMRGDTAQSTALLEAALAKHPADAGYLALVLPALAGEHQTAQAVTLAEAAHEAAPADSNITTALAEAYVRAGQQDRAIGLLDRASAGNNPRLDFLRAGILAQLGKTEQAKAVLQTILDKSPGDTNARLLIAGLDIKAGDFAAARDTLREGLKQTPGNPALLDDLVGIDLRQSGSTQAGLKAALATAAGLRAVPANLPAAYALPGGLYLAAGDARAAAAAFLAAYKQAPSADLAIKAASAAKSAGNEAQAIALLEAWTAAHPDDTAPLFVLSSFYLESGRLDPAARLLQAVLAADSTNAAALNNLAWIRQRQGNGGEAKILAEHAYFQSPGAETADTLGWILAQQNDTGAALPLLKQAAASTAPSLHAAAAYHYAVALAASGQGKEARAQLEPVLASGTSFRDRDDAARFLTTLK
jgi:putative PEP-CTERM system TPR-repeat lipoprotein